MSVLHAPDCPIVDPRLWIQGGWVAQCTCGAWERNRIDAERAELLRQRGGVSPSGKERP